MTYHPIDKPTEPGLYWHVDERGTWRVCRVSASQIGAIVDSSMTTAGGYGGPGCLVGEYSGQFYGPPIKPPTPSEVNVSKSDVPRRFRWRERIKARGLPRKVTGVGVCWLREGEFLYECWPGETSSVVPSQVEITEWLDPEPEKPEPQRFRWKLSATGYESVGLQFQNGRSLIFTQDGYVYGQPPDGDIVLLEWLDPEPEKPKLDAWQVLFDAVAKERPVTKEEVAAAIDILRKKVPLS